LLPSLRVCCKNDLGWMSSSRRRRPAMARLNPLPLPEKVQEQAPRAHGGLIPLLLRHGILPGIRVMLPVRVLPLLRRGPLMNGPLLQRPRRSSTTLSLRRPSPRPTGGRTRNGERRALFFLAALARFNPLPPLIDVSGGKLSRVLFARPVD
jgi:hypothetical protein